MIVISEYVYNKPGLYERSDIKQEARRKLEKKYGGNYFEEVRVEFNVKFLGIIGNKTKNLTTKNTKKQL